MEPEDVIEALPSARLGEDLNGLAQRLRRAHWSDIDVEESFKLYALSYKELAGGSRLDAFLHYQKAGYELTNAVNEAKFAIGGWRVQSPRTLSFFFRLYGLYAVFFGLAASAIFAALIYTAPSARVLDVPLWSSFFAGLGSSAQIIAGVARDVKDNGISLRYRGMWYAGLPVLAAIFGFMAYMLMDSGIVAFNVYSQESALSVMVVCFLVGLFTDWMMSKFAFLTGG